MLDRILQEFYRKSTYYYQNLINFGASCGVSYTAVNWVIYGIMNESSELPSSEFLRSELKGRLSQFDTNGSYKCSMNHARNVNSGGRSKLLISVVHMNFLWTPSATITLYVVAI